MDRRTVFSGLAMAGLIGCDRRTPAPAEPEAQGPRDTILDLSDLERENGGRIGLAAEDMNRVSWRPDERFNYCSTFKLFLAAAMLEKIQRDQEKFDRAIPITQADMLSHAPVTEKAIGRTLTIEQLMQATVEVSDNPAANILIRELGGLDALRNWYRSMGDNTTTIDRLEPFLNRRDGDKDTAQPRQIATNLGWILETYQPLGFASHYALLWNWLIQSSTGPGRIKAGVPQGWTVAHKTGTGGSGQTNDIGVIHPPTGEAIRIAVYYDAPEALSEAAREAVIAEATRRAISALARDVPALAPAT